MILFTLVTAVIDLPLSYYAGFVVPHQFNLSNQTFAAWLGDEAKGLMIGLVFSVIVIPLALLGIRKFKRWWLVLWVASIPLAIVLFVIVPVVVDPVFNNFIPLRDQVLKQKLLDEASRAGIEGSRVYQVDKSKQTKTMNAYVTGLGPTKRIVMWDTLLAKLNHDEILAVMGHEMGHYVLHHVWKGLADGIIGTFFVLFSRSGFTNGACGAGVRAGERERPAIPLRCRGCSSSCRRSRSSARRSRTGSPATSSTRRTSSASSSRISTRRWRPRSSSSRRTRR